MSHFYYDEKEDDNSGYYPELTDIDCDGKRELVIMPFTRGAHCCFGLKIWKFDNYPKLFLEKIEKDKGGYGLKDIDNDGCMDIVLSDDTWTYWNTDYTSSPSMTITMALVDGEYEYYDFSPDIPDSLTIYEGDKITRISAEEYKSTYTQLVNKVKNNKGWKEHSAYKLTEYWATILQFLEFGYTNEAYCFSREAWGSSERAYNSFIKGFYNNLVYSYHIEYIRLKNPKLDELFTMHTK